MNHDPSDILNWPSATFRARCLPRFGYHGADAWAISFAFQMRDPFGSGALRITVKEDIILTRN